MTNASPSAAATLPDDLVQVRATLVAMQAEGRHEELLGIVLALLHQVREKNTDLEQRLAKALRALYGRKSEKVSGEHLTSLFEAMGLGPDGLPLPPDSPAPTSDEAPADDAPADGAPEAGPGPDSGPVPPPAAPPKPPKGKHGRKPLPDALPRRKKRIPVPESERVCERCGGPKSCMGYHTSSILEFVPGHFEVIVEEREKVACRPCGEGVVIAESEKLTDRGRPGPGLLADLIVSKFADSLPLYRQGQRYARLGVELSSSTLSDWNAFALDVVAPLAKRMEQRALSDSYLRVDDTSLRVLDRKHPQGIKKGHIWVYVGGGMVFFRYTPTWEAQAKGPAHGEVKEYETCATVLLGFTGFVQGDGYKGYEAALNDRPGHSLVPEERRLGCLMHARRKFEEAFEGKEARAAFPLSWIKKLYEVEAQAKTRAKERGLSVEEMHALRHEMRQKTSLPILLPWRAWLDEIQPKLMPKTLLAVAVTYAINQWNRLVRCFSEGRFEIDNGESERQLKVVALGRKNFMFGGSDAGAERIGIAYTVMGCCKLYGVNPWAYLRDVIEKVQGGWPKDRLDELLPDAWATRKNAEASEAPPSPRTEG